MHRLLITLTFPPEVGGMQNFAYLRCLRAGDQPVVLVPWCPGSEEFDAGQPFSVLRWRPVAGHVQGVKRVGQILQPMRLADRVLRRKTFDAIECWQPLPIGLAGWWLKRRHQLPLIVWSHGSDLLRVARVPLGKILLRQVLSQADRLIANSMATQMLMVRLGQDPSRIRVIRPPVEYDRFHPALDPTPVRTQHALGHAPVILTVARLVEKKGVDMVLRALPGILAAVPEARYLVVGDGPLRPQLQALSEALGVSQSVLFVGAVGHDSPDLPRYYAASDVYVMPSRTLDSRGEIESFGISFLEAGACGKPVVAGRGGGTAEAVLDGVNGLVVDPLNPEDIARSVIRLLTDAELAHRVGEAGRRLAVQRRPWEHLHLG